ncbi:DUF2637 domain-containing protein [Streptomyces mobaraensis]|uniref:DUF2637 domain-containing protein n=1 Tax=Streptomyces mobaraensis TaxID=35621 RepID=A0A5N5WEE6_STRMB|nr:DUF2637 domain-containing protein [Streptomyces mobaraensis]KAB7850149.1 DUF2637 domain-containing protein [Streptomyces mobaraensis]
MVKVNFAELGKIKSRLVWWISLGIIGGAAAGMTGWSLYFVAHHRYGVPGLLAVGPAAVFDGTAMACLYLAGQAVRERRSALGPHLATLGMATVSIYLNRLHADLIHGGGGAFLLFAMPTVALLVLAGLSWSAQRARQRAQDGDVPVSLPKLGFWAWLLATDEAWKRTKDEVEAHVSGTDKLRPASGQAPVKPRTAAEALRAHFATLNPVDAIRTAHSAMPTATPGQLAAELERYDIHVSAVDVAFVLGYQPPTARVDRPDAVRTAPDALASQEPKKPLTSADILSGQPDTVADAARQLISLGITDKGKAVPLIVSALGLDDAKADSVRRTFDRQLGKHGSASSSDGQLILGDGIGQGGGGYA